ncbi:MAG TPA: hypothetical protein VGF44_07015 [Terriglobales bacterium]|jgi:hypothetical protein
MFFRPALALVFILSLSMGTSNQLLGQSQEGVPKLPDEIRNSPNTSDVPMVGDDAVQRQQAIAAARIRQQEILRDSAALAQLSADLKEQVIKANGQMLSVDAIKKAEQIEKLAHGLKGKMKLAY